MREGGGGVGPQAVHRYLLHVRPVVEVVVALVETRGSPEVIHGRRVHTRLREPRGELLIERMKPANIGEDRGPRRVGCLRASAEGVEPIAVGRLDHHALAPGDTGAAGDRRERRSSGRFEAHPVVTSSVDVVARGL